MQFRKATIKDLPKIIEMLADDELGKTREEYKIPLPHYYVDAFHRINEDKNQELIVIENEGLEIVGTLQLTFIQYLNRKASSRMLIESVRIRSDQRGLGIGEQMMEWAIARAKERKVNLIQLTSDKKRLKAIKFYENLGFIASHQGLKMQL